MPETFLALENSLLSKFYSFSCGGGDCLCVGVFMSMSLFAVGVVLPKSSTSAIWGNDFCGNVHVYLSIKMKQVLIFLSKV